MRIRPIHAILGCVILAVFLVGYLEVKPDLEEFDPVLHAEFKDTWKQRVHLSYWEKWGSFEGDACQSMVDAFNSSQKEIYVHHIRTSEIDRKSMLAIVGGDPPDVLGIWSRNVTPFAGAGALEPLDDRMAQSGLLADDYTANYLRLGQYEGRTFALPTTPTSVALFWNKDHFRRKAKELKAAGLDPERAPRTIEELDKYVAVLNEFAPDGSPVVMGFLPSEPGWFNYTWGYYFGGQLADAQGKITTDDEGNVRAFMWVKRFAEAYGRQKLLQFRQGFGTFDSPQNAFIDGKVSMEMQGVWFPNFVRRHRPHMDFGVAAFPTAEGVKGPMSYLESDMITIPRGCRHPEAAWKFVYWVQTKGLEILNRQQGKHMPLRANEKNKAMLDAFHASHPNRELSVFEEVAASKYSFPMPPSPVQQEYQDEINKAFEHIWNWPVPEDQLTGLSGPDRQKKVDELCRAEIVRTLADVRRTIQGKLDQERERTKMREDRR